jgi:hypothetical protein
LNVVPVLKVVTNLPQEVLIVWIVCLGKCLQKQEVPAVPRVNATLSREGQNQKNALCAKLDRTQLKKERRRALIVVLDVMARAAKNAPKDGNEKKTMPLVIVFNACSAV